MWKCAGPSVFLSEVPFTASALFYTECTLRNTRTPFLPVVIEPAFRRNTATVSGKQSAPCCFLARLFTRPDDGGDVLLRNVGWTWTGYTAIYPSRELFLFFSSYPSTVADTEAEASCVGSACSQNRGQLTVLTVADIYLEPLCYKPGARGFETRWGEFFLFFSIYLVLPSALGPGIYSASNRNEDRKQKNSAFGDQSAACA
jgi:hypothetical protein